MDVIESLHRTSVNFREVEVNWCDGKKSARIPATVEVSDTLPPVPLNPDSIQAITLRLIDRYGQNKEKNNSCKEN